MSRLRFMRVLLDLHTPYTKILGPYRRQAVLCVVMSGLAGVFELTALIAIAPILGIEAHGNKVTGALSSLFKNDGIFSSPWLQFLILIGAGFASGAVRWLSLKRVVALRYLIEQALRERMAERLLAMDWERYHNLSSGSVNNSFMTGIRNVGEGIEAWLRLWSVAIVVVVLLASSAVLAPQLIAIAVGYGIFVGIMSRFVTGYARPWMQKSATHSHKVAAVAHEVVDNLKYIRASGLQAWARGMLKDAFDRQKTIHSQNLRYSELHRLGIEVVGITFIALLVVVYKTTKAVDLSTFIIFLGIFYRCVPRVQQLQGTLYQVNAKLSWLDWLKNMEASTSAVSVQPERSGAVARNMITAAPSVAFDRVSFAYAHNGGDESRRMVLDNLSFHVRPAEFLAIAGPSGSGKSTILGLLLGLLHPMSGRILVNGTSAGSMGEAAARGLLGYLPQEPQLFSASILANVALGDNTPDPERAKACLKSAMAWDFVSTQPDGLDTMVGEKGGRLSGGERQRIALARALYRNPSVLLLDEPTSALDHDNTLKLREVLRRLKGKMTIIMITHQTDLFDLADEIVRLTPVPADRYLPDLSIPDSSSIQ